MEELKFEELELCPEILKAVKHMGFEEASPIQSKAIPVIMSGKDVIGQAQTGTGKTAAFGIPLLEKIDPKNKKLQAIVLCPTRELAIQVAEEIRNLAKYMHGINIAITDIYPALFNLQILWAVYLKMQLIQSIPSAPFTATLAINIPW